MSYQETAVKPSRHSDDDPNTGLWFITEPGHIETLAECVRVGNIDDIDVARIYWMGKTLRSMNKQLTDLREKLDVEQEFNRELRDATETFVEIYESKDYIEKDPHDALDDLVEVIFKHTVGKHKKDHKKSFLDAIRIKFAELFMKGRKKNKRTRR